MPICGGIVRRRGAGAGIRLLRARFVRWRYCPAGRRLPAAEGARRLARPGCRSADGREDEWTKVVVHPSSARRVPHVRRTDRPAGVRTDYGSTSLRTSATPIAATQTRNAAGAVLLFDSSTPAKLAALRPAAPAATVSGHPLTTSTTQATPSRIAPTASPVLSPRRRRECAARSGVIVPRAPEDRPMVLRDNAISSCGHDSYLRSQATDVPDGSCVVCISRGSRSAGIPREVA